MTLHLAKTLQRQSQRVDCREKCGEESLAQHPRHDHLLPPILLPRRLAVVYVLCCRHVLKQRSSHCVAGRPGAAWHRMPCCDTQDSTRLACCQHHTLPQDHAPCADRCGQHEASCPCGQRAWTPSPCHQVAGWPSSCQAAYQAACRGCRGTSTFARSLLPRLRGMQQGRLPDSQGRTTAAAWEQQWSVKRRVACLAVLLRFLWR